MKRFIVWNIILLPAFFFGLCSVNASTSPELVYTIDNCFLYNTGNSVNFNSGAGYNVLVYSIPTNVELSFTFNGGDRLRVLVGTFNDTPNFQCSTTSLSSFETLLNISSPVVNNVYSITSSYDYAFVYVGPNGSITWSGSVEPEPEPEPEPLTFDDLIYVPEDSTYNKCYVVQSEGVIRGYDVTPALSTNYNYRDYYINSSYIYRDGSGSWSQYSTLPICLDSEKLTNDFYYRLDFDKICIIFITLALFGILLPIKIFSKILLGKGGL